MKIYGFGIIGAGLIADFHARALNDIHNAQLRGFCDNAPDKAKELAKKYSCRFYDDYHRIINDPDIDIVTIATPSGTHMEIAIAAAEASKHVICEKPIEITLARIDAMIEAHDKAKTYLGGIFQNRFVEAMIPLRKAISEGRFGEITYVGVYVPWWRSDKYYEDSWHGTWKLDGGGALMNQSIHMIDMLCDLMPPVKDVKSFIGSLAHNVETEDTAVTALRFANGALGIIYGTTASYPGGFKRFEITGTQGTAVYLENSFSVWQFAEEKPEDKQIREKFNQINGLGGVADPGAITHENHKKNFEAFIKAIDSDNKFFLDGREARKAVKLILDIYKAARES